MTKYIQEKQTELFDELGVFFAFSREQFEEQRQHGVAYCSVLGGGDYVPLHNAELFVERLSAIHQEGRKRELAEKGIDVIIEEQLVNHECFYTGEIENVVDVLAAYEVTYDQVKAIYRKVAHKYSNW